MPFDLNLDDDDQDMPIPLTKVSSAVLKKIILWCEHYENPPAPEEGYREKHFDLSPREREFFKIEPKILVELIIAADYLCIENFLSKALQAGAFLLMGGKNAANIRKMCKIKKDFSEEEEDKENAWSVISGLRIYKDKHTPCDYFPLDDLSVQIQLGMYEYLFGWTLNEVRKVDRLRRRLVDDIPRIYEKQRLIPKVEVGIERNPNERLTLKFYDYCKCGQGGRRSSIALNFDIESTRCTKGARSCFLCDRAGVNLPSSSPVIGLPLEECCHWVTKGSKIEELKLVGDISNEFVQRVRHLVDSSRGPEWDVEPEESEYYYYTYSFGGGKLKVVLYFDNNAYSTIEMRRMNA